MNRLRFYIFFISLSTLTAMAQSPEEQGIPASATPLRNLLDFTEHRIPVAGNFLYAREYKGDEPTLVLLHGFPDNLHLYDRLIPHLSANRLIAFDFMGWGQSDKPADYAHTAGGQTSELDAVITYFDLQQPILVAHDASGPPAINWAITHPGVISELVLLNTYYCNMPSLRAPEAIFLFSTPLIRAIARPVSKAFGNYVFRKMYRWQVGRFFTDRAVANEFVPILYEQFRKTTETQRAFFGLNNDLRPTLRLNDQHADSLKSYPGRVTIIFGANDAYLNAGVARSFHGLFPQSTVHLLPNARHFVQMDRPADVANLILSQ